MRLRSVVILILAVEALAQGNIGPVPGSASVSPPTATFGGPGFEYTDEFYRMPPYSPDSSERQHVLLSLDSRPIRYGDRRQVLQRVCAFGVMMTIVSFR
jgi:hypothetical protein